MDHTGFQFSFNFWRAFSYSFLNGYTSLHFSCWHLYVFFWKNVCLDPLPALPLFWGWAHVNFVLVVLDFLFFYSLFKKNLWWEIILFILIPHQWEVPTDRLSGCFPEPLILLSLSSPDWTSECLEALAPRQLAPDSQRHAQRLTLAMFYLLAHAHRTQWQSAVCPVPAGQRTYRFWKSRPDPQTLGSTQQSLWGNSVSVSERFNTNRGAVCFCVKACI